MGNEKVTVCLKIRRIDSFGSSEIAEKNLELNTNYEYNTLKKEIQEICEVAPEDNKVIKVRRDDEVLVPLSYLIESNEPASYFYLDICKINYCGNKATATLLQDAYIDSVCQKLRNMESRIIKAETLLPQLEWRKESHMEETVTTLSNRVSFLNRRLDELLPAEWKTKMPQAHATL